MASFAASSSLAGGVVQATRGPSLGARRSASRQQQRLIVRAEGEGKVVREFNEGDGKISTPGGEKKDEALYADQIPKRKDSGLSKEMEEKMRQEYLGFGGSANQSMGGNYFLYIILFVSALAIASKLIGAI